DKVAVRVRASPPNDADHVEIPGRSPPEISLNVAPPVSSNGGGASVNFTYLPLVYASEAYTERKEPSFAVASASSPLTRMCSALARYPRFTDKSADCTWAW